MLAGIDLGGTKIEAVALDDRRGVVRRLRLPTPRDDYEATIAAVVALVEGLGVAAGIPIGVAAPGAISPATGLVKNSNSRCLNGRPLDRDLASALGRPVRLANDADCFSLSEAVDGAAEGARVVFGVIVGTGTGGGIAVDKRLLAGPNAITGEWGHNPLPWPQDDERPGPECYCGKRGCIETFLSGPGLASDYQRHVGVRLDPPEIAARAQAGDPSACAVMEGYEDRMARALAGVINILDPDAIVLGGGVSNIAQLYEDVPRLWGEYVFSDRVGTRLVRARHGDSSGVRGAAWLWDGGAGPGVHGAD